MRVILTVIFAVFSMTIGLSSVAFAGDAANGKKIFESKSLGKCKVCHNVTAKKKVGPGLKGVGGSYSPEWLKKWIMDPQGVWAENGEDVQKLKTKVKKTKKKKTSMKLKKKLSSSDADDVVAYLLTL